MAERMLFGQFFLDQEKDMIVDLFREDEHLFFVLRTPNHATGNLITNLAKLCDLPVSADAEGRRIIEGEVPGYIDGYNRLLYIFRLGNTKVANIYPDGTIEMKASVPAISKTLMSQTKDYRLGIKETVVKTFIRQPCKFHTDLHTHMNANLPPDVLIALGIAHQIRYPLYYIKKLGLHLTPAQTEALARQREGVEAQCTDPTLVGKYRTRRIDDNTFINFADLILRAPEHAAHNIAKIRASLAIMKDGQAVFTNLEKVYLYRYVFTKGVPAADPMLLMHELIERIPDADIAGYVLQMLRDRKGSAYRDNTLFQDKLLWIARRSRAKGVDYLEISDTTLVKDPEAAGLLAQVHAVMPQIRRETGVTIRLLAAIRRIPLTIVRDAAAVGDYFRENLQVLDAVAGDPYVAGADIIGEEINDIRTLAPVIRRIVEIAGAHPGFVVRIHAGENDSLRDNVANSLACVQEALAPGQAMPHLRIGHGLYTANLRTKKGKELIAALRESGAVLEFQITSNVRLNNLTSLAHHPLRDYLAGGVRCVQGTDGGAIYGTDSIDEQLSLEKMLNVSEAELLRMRQCEAAVMADALRHFEEEQAAWEALGVADVAEHYRAQIVARASESEVSFIDENKLVSKEVFAEQIEEMPAEGTPVVLLGGSFNSDRRSTTLQTYGTRIIDALLAEADPARVFFVIGHRLRGYEKYLIEQNRTRYEGRFRIYAMVPTMVTRAAARRIETSKVRVRIAIESAAMGLYKSIAYEVFKRRPSILIAMDGNSAGANLIQEAKNAKYPCRIYVNSHARILRTKAESLGGYVTLFRDESILESIIVSTRA